MRIVTRDAQTGASQRDEWRQLASGYAVFACVAGIPCTALSIYFSEPWIIVGWAEFFVGLPILMGMVTILWAVTAFPLLLLMVLIFDRGKGPDHFDPDGPGVIVCR